MMIKFHQKLNVYKSCFDNCLYFLDHLGFKRVGFSNYDGKMEIDTVENLMKNSKDYTTNAQKTFRKIASSPYW